MKLVVCDDDATLRSVVSRLAESVGHTVIAETDTADDAVELVSRFGAEALVLDLALPYGSGMRAVHELKARASECLIVVFTAYADDSPEVREASVRAVVEKPDFDELERVLRGLLEGTLGGDGEQIVERRRPWVPRPGIQPAVVPAPSGLEEPDSFAAVVERLEVGDGALAVHLTPLHPADDPWSVLVETDRLLAVARELRAVLRVQDRMTYADGALVALLLEGGRAGVESVWHRLTRVQELEGVSGVLSAGWALRQETEPAYATVARARGAAARSVGQPPGERLWAG